MIYAQPVHFELFFNSGFTSRSLTDWIKKKEKNILKYIFGLII